MNATMTDLDLATASPKLLVAEMLQKMPAETTFSEIVREIKTLAGVRRGLIESRQGKGTPDEEFDREIQSWLCVARRTRTR